MMASQEPLFGQVRVKIASRCCRNFSLGRDSNTGRRTVGFVSGSTARLWRDNLC
jgi:hypothetical protein